MGQVIVHKGRTNIILVRMGIDVSQDTFVSEIREEKSSESNLIAAWNIQFETDGIDGDLVLSLDDSVTSEVTRTKGYMDIKRITSGEPVAVFDEPVEVLFKNSITA